MILLASELEVFVSARAMELLLHAKDARVDKERAFECRHIARFFTWHRKQTGG